MIRFLLFFLFISCNVQDDFNNSLNQDSNSIWRVDLNKLKEGAPFPIVTSPSFKSVYEINKLSNDTKCLLVKINNEIRAYPYVYTNYSEVVNDTFLTHELAISYCPQTKSGICFNKEIKDFSGNLIASGYLFNDNLVLSDSKLNLFWSQMLIEGIKGDAYYNDIDTFFAIEMSWEMIKRYFPSSKVYYREDITVKILDVENDEYYKKDDKYFGVINKDKSSNSVDLYSYSFFNKLKLDIKNINKKKAVIVGDNRIGYVVSFYVPDNFTFSLLDNDFPYVLIDDKGGKWDVFGFSSNGNVRLESPSFFSAELWAWKAFYEDITYN
ncbi:MAG: DUF3179 domain-containing (seleno)protein [Tenacibaculum sp.]